MSRWRKMVYLMVCAALSLLLSGCMFNASLEDMYELPQVPDEYASLRDQIDAILSDGVEYAAPASGANVQSVQMTDLDGDGVEEAVAFFRNAAEEKPLKIYIFREEGDGYVQSALIEGSGTAVYSIRYADLNADDRKELLVGWRVSTDIQALGVYELDGKEPQALMFSLYSRYEVLDFDGDGMQEVVVLRSDQEGLSMAEYYDWESDRLEIASTARLTMTMAELGSVDIGALRGGQAALFATGVSEDTRSITDILTLREDGIANIVRSDYTGVSSEIFRNVLLEPTDIDGDGVTEVPMPVMLHSTGGSDDDHWQIYWRNYNEKGQGEIVCSTYHNTAEGWYLVLPEAWEEEIAVRRTSAVDEQGIVFSVYDSAAETYVDTVGIFSITGSSREHKAVRNGRFLLKRQVDTIYSGVFYPGNESWSAAISQEELNQRFRLIVREWAPSVN